MTRTRLRCCHRNSADLPRKACEAIRRGVHISASGCLHYKPQAVGDKGRVIYTDGDSRNAERARGYFQRAGVANRITLHTGDALEVLSEQKQEFDIIFNDVDKEDYPRVLRLVAPRLRKGGLFITDNVLWSGRVAEKNPSEASTKAILEFNRNLYAANEFYTTILPIRDGLAVALKK